MSGVTGKSPYSVNPRDYLSGNSGIGTSEMTGGAGATSGFTGNNAALQQMIPSFLKEIGQLLQQVLQGGGGQPLGATQQTQQGAGGGPQMSGQSASGALASYMSANNIGSLNPSQLYQLAYNPPANATPTDSAAAKFMLQNPDIYNKIETHDVSGSDGISGVGNFQWAAQGGLGSAGGAPSLGGGMSQTPSFGSGGGMPQTPSFGTGGTTPQTPAFTMPAQTSPTPTGLPTQGAGGGQQLNAQSASGALASYMSANNVGSLDPSQLYQLAYNPPSNATPTDSAAAKWMLQNPDVFNKIETHDVSGSDGISGVGNFQWAAQGGLNGATGQAG